jgi:hypothetical protein
MLGQPEEYAGTGASKYRPGRGLVTDAESLKHLGEYDTRVAGRTGVERITARKTTAGERVVTVEGRLLEGFADRARTPPTSTRRARRAAACSPPRSSGSSRPTGSGRTCGARASATRPPRGSCSPPGAVNQIAQNRGIEGYMRELGLARPGATYASRPRRRPGATRRRATGSRPRAPISCSGPSTRSPWTSRARASRRSG